MYTVVEILFRAMAGPTMHDHMSIVNLDRPDWHRATIATAARAGMPGHTGRPDS
jgi:hypothetical protein